MPRIFHIITHFELGGAERVAINIAKSKNPDMEYHLVEVARGKSEFTENLLKELQDNRIRYHRSPIGKKKLGIILFPFWFLLLYLKYRPNIIHTHTEVPDLSIYLFHLIYPWHKAYLRTIHNTELWNDWKGIGKKVEKFFISHHSNIAISESVRNCYEKNYHDSGIPLIYNGVEIKEQKSFPELVPGKKNILFAGRLEEQKGVKTLVKVVNRLKDNPNYFSHTARDGSQKNELSKLSGHNYRLYEKIYDLASYMGSFDYMFMPSNHEGLGLICVEASLAHAPTIINACPGLNETLPNDWPLKVENNSIDEYMEIFNDKLPNLSRQNLGNTIFQYASMHFSIEQMQQKYEKIYHERAKA